MAIRNTSFELTIGKHEDKLECSLIRPDYPAMNVPNINLPLDPKDTSDITTSFNKVISLARKETSSEKFMETLTVLGMEVGWVLEPILKHFNLIERKGKECLNLTLRLDKQTVKIPWELASFQDEPAVFLSQRMNIGRMMEVQRKEGFVDTSNAKKGPKERRALVVGIDYKKSRSNWLDFAQNDAKIVHKQLEAFGKKNKLKVLPLLVGGNAKKSVIEKHFKGGLDIFHFSGHGNLDGNIGKISLNKREFMSAQKVDEMLHKFKIKAPKFSFMNACETCLQKSSRLEVEDWAHAMARNGGRALIGTFWAVLDHDSTIFSTAFYRNFFAEEKAIGESVRMAREETAEKMKAENFCTWPAFVLYGPPTLKASDILD
jgi:CHAT domain-containing protein